VNLYSLLVYIEHNGDESPKARLLDTRRLLASVMHKANQVQSYLDATINV